MPYIKFKRDKSSFYVICFSQLLLLFFATATVVLALLPPTIAGFTLLEQNYQKTATLFKTENALPELIIVTYRSRPCDRCHHKHATISVRPNGQPQTF